MRNDDAKEHWESLREEALGIFSVWARGKASVVDSLDLFWLWMALRRSAPSKKWAEFQKRAEEFLETLTLEAARKALNLVQLETWKADLEVLATFYDQMLGASSSPQEEEAYALEASRLFRLLDYWRLAVLGMQRRFPRSRKISRIVKTIEEDLVERVMARPELFADLSEDALATLNSFRKDLAETDPELAGTRDVYTLVAAQGELEGWDFTGNLGEAQAPLARILPPLLPAAAAKAKTSPRTVSFLWKSPKGDSWAYLDFQAGTAEKERRRSLQVVLRGPQGIEGLEKVRVFDLELPVRRGKATLNQAKLREALEKAWSLGRPRAASFQVKPAGKKRWVKWKMVAPMEESE